MNDIKMTLNIFFYTLLHSVGTAQTIGVALPQLKAPPQYSKTFLSKTTIQKTDNQQVEQKIQRPIPLVFCVETLPFFCKIEHKMGLNQKLPIKFRLGDVQYVDELEGKRRSN